MRRRLGSCWSTRSVLFSIVSVLGTGGTQGRVPEVTQAQGFGDTVAAIFRARCVRCHGPDKDSGGLRLDGYDAVMRGGERGPVVVPGNPNASLLMQKVLRRDRPPMPPQTSLAAREVRAIRAWITLGATP
jgi:mono/diheme cytochrome c family protein